MTGTTTLKRLNKNTRCFVIKLDDEEKGFFGSSHLVIKPLNSWGEPMFYWRKNIDGTYHIEGEGYFCNGGIKEHKEDVKETWGNQPIKWLEIDEEGNLIKK